MSSRRGKPPSSRGLEQRVLRRWRRLELPPDTAILVGFSGGPDSLALAACLAQIRPLLCGELLLLHVDHGLRPTSGSEAKRAIALATELGLECRVARIDRVSLEAHHGVGIEESARRERYRAFAEVVAGNDNTVFALAHHQKDQAETVLLHLLRGAGGHGAGGMREFSELAVPWWLSSLDRQPTRLQLWRPFLFESLDVVHNYIAAKGLAPIFDESNDSLEFRRNAIRHCVIPLLEQISPGATAAIGRFASLSAEDDQYLSAEASEILVRARNDDGSLSIDELRATALALRRRVVLLWLSGIAGLEPRSERVEAILQLLERPRSDRTVQIGGRYVVTASVSRLLIYPA